MTNRYNAATGRGHGLAAAALATLLALGAATASAHIPEQDEADAREAEISAHEAKRLVRRFLIDNGYSMQPRLGGARIRSITRDGDTWVVRVDIRPGTTVRRERVILYVDANSGRLTDRAPQEAPRIAAE